MSTENQIHLIGNFRRDEKRAAAGITPGHLVEIIAAGTVQVHSVEGGYGLRLFAELDALQGQVITHAYLVTELVALNHELPGNVCQAFLKAGETAVIGSELISAGDGTLIVNGSEDSATTVEDIIAIAHEALDLSGSGAVDTLMEVIVHP